MRLRILTLTALLLTSLAAPALADHDGRPHEGEHGECKDRETTCDDVDAGTMRCMPPAGEAGDLGVVVGMRDSGQFRLTAHAVNDATSASLCDFRIHVDPSEIRFNTGWVPELVGTPGGITYVDAPYCFTVPGQSCDVVTTFGWWRAAHGVTFDVPYTLYVNGQPVARGEVHYYDPPMIEHVTGGPVVLR